MRGGFQNPWNSPGSFVGNGVDQPSTERVDQPIREPLDQPITEPVGQPISEPLYQPITALTTERENVYNKRFSQSTPSPDEDLQVAVETSRSFDLVLQDFHQITS